MAYHWLHLSLDGKPVYVRLDLIAGWRYWDRSSRVRPDARGGSELFMMEAGWAMHVDQLPDEITKYIKELSGHVAKGGE